MKEQPEIHIIAKGSGSSGCLLNHNLQDETNFIRIPLDFHPESLGVTASFVLALVKKGQLFIWGSLAQKIIPYPIKIKEHILQINCGWEHALMKSEHFLFGLGNNCNGQLGLPPQNKYIDSPQPVWQGKVDLFCAGFRQSYLKVEQKMYGCGQSRKFELGVVSQKSLGWSCIIDNLKQHIIEKIESIYAGKRFLILLTSAQRVFGFGNNQQNCFNNSGITSLKRATHLYSDVKSVAVGWAHIVLLKTDRKIQSYGRNNLGQLGHGNETHQISFPLQNQEEMFSIASGSEFSFALTSKGRLFGWGWNQHGNIIPSEQKILRQPVQIDVPSNKCLRVWTNPATTFVEVVDR